MSPNCDFVNGIPCGNVTIVEDSDNYLGEERRLFSALSINDKHHVNERQRVDPYARIAPINSANISLLQNNVHSMQISSRTYAPNYDTYHRQQTVDQPPPELQQPTTRPESKRPRGPFPPQHQLQQQLQQQQRIRQQQPFPLGNRNEFGMIGIMPGNRFQNFESGMPRTIGSPSQNFESGLPRPVGSPSLNVRRNTGDMSDMTKRLETFFTWPKTAYLEPFELAEAGFVYTGTGDAVKCYKCGVSLKNWEPKDNAWVEHERWSPMCPLVVARIRKVDAEHKSRGHNHVYNAYGQQQAYSNFPQQQQQPSYSPTPMTQETHSSFDESYARRFKQQQHSQPLLQSMPGEKMRSLPTGIIEGRYQFTYNENPTYLDNYRSSAKEISYPPRNGFRTRESKSYEQTTYPIQNASVVSNDPRMVEQLNLYNAHQAPPTAGYAKHYMQREQNPKTTINNQSSSNWDKLGQCNGSLLSKHISNTSLSSQKPLKMSSNPQSPRKAAPRLTFQEMVEKMSEMGFSREIVEKTINCYTTYASRSFSSVDDLAQAVIYFEENGTLEGTPFGKNLNVKPTKAGEDMIYHKVSNDKPLEIEKGDEDRRLCKICMENDIEITFVPCGHLIVCESCALGLKFCPICRSEIGQTIRTYMG